MSTLKSFDFEKVTIIVANVKFIWYLQLGYFASYAQTWKKQLLPVEIQVVGQ